MQIIHTFNISPREYSQKGKKNDFPRINNCPCCSYPSTLPRHGFYWRNALFLKSHYRIPILRLKCPSCGKTISLLPDFLLPHFQYSLEYILEVVRQFFVQSKTTIYYQLLQFYRRRFRRNLNRILAFYRDQGYRGFIPEKDKAIKLLKLIGASPEAETFAKRFQVHFQHNFMAN
ncbi:MAG: DUF6431 domain-containing protein [Dethiobacteria bacterium]|jgi:hypothetical protein